MKGRKGKKGKADERKERNKRGQNKIERGRLGWGEEWPKEVKWVEGDGESKGRGEGGRKNLERLAVTCKRPCPKGSLRPVEVTGGCSVDPAELTIWKD